MPKSFNELRKKMSPESQKRASEKCEASSKHILMNIDCKESEVLCQGIVDFFRSKCSCGWRSNWLSDRGCSIRMYELHLIEQPGIEYEFEDIELWQHLVKRSKQRGVKWNVFG